MITIADVVDTCGDSIRVGARAPANKTAVIVDAYMSGELHATFTLTAAKALELSQALIKAVEVINES